MKNKSSAFAAKTAPIISPFAAEETLLLVDGYGFVFRAYHSLPPLTRADGTPVGAVYGFMSMLLRLLSQHTARYIGVVLDSGDKNFRHELYPAYKANRPPAPEDLLPQFPLLKDVVAALSLPSLLVANTEADDVIATYARLAVDAGLKVVIVSSDKDLTQLVSENVRLFDPMKSYFVGAVEVKEKFGVLPEKMGDFLALVGDSSDNIPGVPGIGPKTASELLEIYGSLEDLLLRAGEIPQNKRRETLQENQEKARLSRKLVALNQHVDVKIPLQDLLPAAPDLEKIGEFLQAQSFQSLRGRVAQWLNISENNFAEKKSASQNSDKNVLQINSHEEAKIWWQNVCARGALEAVAIYVDASAVQLFVSTGQAAVISFVEHEEEKTQDTENAGDLFSFAENQEKQVISKYQRPIFRWISEWFEANDVVFAVYDAKEFFHLWQSREGSLEFLRRNSARIHDVKLQSYLLHGTVHSHELGALAERYVSAVSGKNQAQVIFSLYQKFRQEIFSAKLSRLYYRVEQPLSLVIAEMEISGIAVDAAVLSRLSHDFGVRLLQLEKKILELSGAEFNVASPKQLGEILFEKMQLPGGKKSGKTGQYTTDSDVLEDLSNAGYEIAGTVLEWRKLAKLKSTYTDSLPKQIRADGRIHTHFAMAATSTGRLSSSDPNLQNIPIRSPEGHALREAFVAAEGCVLVSADYSQIELRLLAHMADIPSLRQAFLAGEDIHVRTASDLFSVPIEAVDDDLRRRAKTINFGIIYGMSAFGLASRLGISRTEAADFIARYFQRYPGIERYIEETLGYARAHSYVKTLWGRKCFVPGIAQGNPSLRQFSERAAINAPLQGSAADMIKAAMLAVYQALRDENRRAKILLQVHDELVLEVAADEAEAVENLLRQKMENVCTLSVPLVVDVSVGKNWAEL